MCRFALIKSTKPIKPEEILHKFAAMAKNCPAYDGDWQGDGWGISWLNTKSIWQSKKSLNPIWEEQNVFTEFPETNVFAIHARSASFEHHKGEIEYNQPYINDPYAFVFNGHLSKVHFKEKIPGKIGAQKLFFLINKMLKIQEQPVDEDVNFLQSPGAPCRGEEAKNGHRVTPVEYVLQQFDKMLQQNVDDIQACNIGLAFEDNIYALNLFSKYPEYYQLHYLDTPDLKIICSGQLEGLNLKPMEQKTMAL